MSKDCKQEMILHSLSRLKIGIIPIFAIQIKIKNALIRLCKDMGLDFSTTVEHKSNFRAAFAQSKERIRKAMERAAERSAQKAKSTGLLLDKSSAVCPAFEADGTQVEPSRTSSRNIGEALKSHNLNEALRLFGKPNLPLGIKVLMEKARKRAEKIKEVAGISRLDAFAYGDRGVVAWSESHHGGTKFSSGVHLGRETLKKLFPYLKNIGVKTLALELPPEAADFFSIEKGANSDAYTDWCDSKGISQRAERKFEEFISGVLGDQKDLLESGFMRKAIERGEELRSEALGKVDSGEETETSAVGSGVWDDYVKLAKKEGINLIAVDCSAEDHLVTNLTVLSGLGLVEQIQKLVDEAYALLGSPSNPRLEDIKEQLVLLYELKLEVNSLFYRLNKDRDERIKENLLKALEEKENGDILFTGGAAHVWYDGSSAMSRLMNFGVPVLGLEILYPELEEVCKESNSVKMGADAEQRIKLFNEKSDAIFMGDKARIGRLISSGKKFLEEGVALRTRLDESFRAASVALSSDINFGSLHSPLMVSTGLDIDGSGKRRYSSNPMAQRKIPEFEQVALGELFDAFVFIPPLKDRKE